MKTVGYYKKNLDNGWVVRKNEYLPDEQQNEETIFTLANGYMGIRGSLEFGTRKGNPATYIAGLFDKKEVSGVAENRGQTLNKAITPAYAIIPDSNLIEICSDGLPFDVDNCEVNSFSRVLDMRKGMVFNSYVLTSASGKTLSIDTLNIVSKVDPHGVLYKLDVKPVNFSGPITVKFKNSLCIYPQTIRRLHDYISGTKLTGVNEFDGICVLDSEIIETSEKIKLLSRTSGEGEKHITVSRFGIDEIFLLKARKNSVYSFSKRSAYYTTHDNYSDAVLGSEPEEKFINAHIAEWIKAWDIADLAIDGDDIVQTGVRWNIFNLIQVANERDADVSISATGLHGQGYFGHAFWDTEIFLLPFYLATNPTVAKNLLTYRYNRLGQAKSIAKAEGCKGAKFPWTSAYTGADITPPDWSTSAKREIHICGAIAYAMHNYYIQTGDYEFYKKCGIETLLETAVYYASRATLGEDGRYHLLDVTGPDEFNIHVKDNYYTNYLAKWNIEQAFRSLKKLEAEDARFYDELLLKTGYNEETLDFLRTVADKMFLAKVRDNVVEQFDGFFGLKDEGVFPRDDDGMPLDRKRVFDSGVQELKQADVIMSAYLFPNSLSAETTKASFEYYEGRCKHGSSLSPSVHCVVGLRNGFDRHAYSYLRLTALLDLNNLSLDKNVYEGIHIACAGGTWSAVVNGFGGLTTDDNGEIHINPKMPAEWKSFSYSFINCGTVFRCSVKKGSFTVAASKKSVVIHKNERYSVDKKPIVIKI